VPEYHHWLVFALIALGLVLTPGPNMLYLVSRSISQGIKAGLVSLVGIALGFIVYLLFAAFGITVNRPGFRRHSGPSLRVAPLELYWRQVAV
jgi:threonine/homoserine/homoserine lactone efflux protein